MVVKLEDNNMSGWKRHFIHHIPPTECFPRTPPLAWLFRIFSRCCERARPGQSAVLLLICERQTPHNLLFPMWRRSISPRGVKATFRSATTTSSTEEVFHVQVKVLPQFDQVCYDCNTNPNLTTAKQPQCTWGHSESLLSHQTSLPEHRSPLFRTYDNIYPPICAVQGHNQTVTVGGSSGGTDNKNLMFEIVAGGRHVASCLDS